MSNSKVIASEQVQKYVGEIYDSSRHIIKEFIDDGILEGFTNIRPQVWVNMLSSVCGLAFKIPEIRGNEKLQEAIVYKVGERIIANDIPADYREDVLKYYKGYGRSVIDFLIPNPDAPCGCCPCG